jgi:predicted Rossmann-fold nucleotide-binding protein
MSPSEPAALTIVSGGQTGVDRAALDVALELGLPCGGWCPRGRRAEDGPIPARYPLRETPSPDYRQRTGWNVRDADATLVLHRGEPSRGTALTLRLATRRAAPCLAVDLDTENQAEPVRRWLEGHAVRRLNVAGPRESEAPGIGEEARRFLRRVLGAKLW